MNRRETAQWIEHHSTLFPPFRKYAREGGDALTDRLTALFAAIELEDALRASDELYRRADRLRLRTDQHPAAVARMAREYAAARGEPVPRRCTEYDRCSWGRCQMPGVCSPTVGGSGPTYCRFHWWCHLRGLEPTSEHLAEWREIASARGGKVLELELSEQAHLMCISGQSNIRY